VKRKRIRWANSLDYECQHSWEAQPGETIEYSKDGQTWEEPARGPHRCVKQYGHTEDPTNDDHQCCCGNTSD